MEDRVLSQTDIGEHPEIAGEPASARAMEFARMLTEFRQDRGITKAELAGQTGLSPSSITRFEQGKRDPERETVLLLARAMVLPLADRDRLLAAAGFRSELWDDPLLIELAQLLNDSGIPESARLEARSVVRMAIAYLKLQRLSDV